MMDTVEAAYEQIGGALVASAVEPWDLLVFQTLILENTCSSMCTKQFLSEEVQSIGLGFERGFKVSDAAVFLRDEMLRATGHRIWGLTFTLYPSGKFKLDYDYSRPGGYVEADGAIDLSDAVSQLKELGAEVQVKGGGTNEQC